MKRFSITIRIALICAACLLASPLVAQTAVERFFMAMPDSMLPVLPQTMREELVLLARGGAEPVVENLFGKPSRITCRRDNHLRVSLTPSSHIELRSLPSDTSQVFCTIHTFLNPAPSSRIVFYNADGRQIDDAFTLPDLREYLNVPDSLAYLARKHWLGILVPLHIEAHWEENADVLVLEVRTQGLSLEDRAGAEGLFRPVRLQWNRGRWEHE